MKRYLVLVTVVLITTVALVAGCGGSPGAGSSISGKYVYKDAAGNSIIINFKSDGTAVITVPTYTDPQTKKQVKEQQQTYYYQTTSKSVGLWGDKKAMSSSDPTHYYLISKNTLTDSSGLVFVKEGTASEKTPSSSTSSSSP